MQGVREAQEAALDKAALGRASEVDPRDPSKEARGTSSQGTAASRTTESRS